ncbi:MAG: cytochrome c biogenesis CcdA family protein [Rhodospirillales bacterium]|nr:cytochrome c biogenesis CcdA family protein [Rhodospirillales bacterium]
MSSNLAFGFLAGSLTTLSPCVLPLLPVLLGGAVQQHRLAPLALATGLAVSFTTVGLFVASLGFALDIDVGAIRITAAVIMAAFGIVMLSPVLQTVFVRVAAPVTGGANGALSRLSGDGLSGQFALGLLLGAAWSPCAGPTLGAAIGLAAQSGTVTQAAATMLLFSLGAVVPMLALAYGSRQVVAARRERLANMAKWGKPVMGGSLVVLGLLIVSGLDKSIETQLTAAMPLWLVDLTTKF